MKVTVPVLVPAPGEVMLTVAVNVTLWPDTLGLPLPDREIVVVALLTAWGTVFDTAPALKLAVPLYCAVMLWLATLSELVVKLAVPPTRSTVPREVVPSKNVTVPVGVAVLGEVARPWP